MIFLTHLVSFVTRRFNFEELFALSASKANIESVNELQIAVQCLTVCTTARQNTAVPAYGTIVQSTKATNRQSNRRVITIPSCATGWPSVSAKPSASSCKTGEKSSSRADSATRFDWNDSLVLPGFPQVKSPVPSPRENVQSLDMSL